jgi:hypothetical protein
MQAKVRKGGWKKTGWRHLMSDPLSDQCVNDFEVVFNLPIANCHQSQSRRMGIREGSHDEEKSRFIDQVINRLRS